MGWEFETEHFIVSEGEVNSVICSFSTVSLQILSWLKGSIEKGNVPNYFYVSSNNF